MPDDCRICWIANTSNQRMLNYCIYFSFIENYLCTLNYDYLKCAISSVHNILNEWNYHHVIIVSHITKIIHIFFQPSFWTLFPGRYLSAFGNYRLSFPELKLAAFLCSVKWFWSLLTLWCASFVSFHYWMVFYNMITFICYFIYVFLACCSSNYTTSHYWTAIK